MAREWGPISPNGYQFEDPANDVPFWETEALPTELDVSIDASVSNTTGTPRVEVTKIKEGQEYEFGFDFYNLKGEKGEKGDTGATGATGSTPNVAAVATVDNNVGTPDVDVETTGTPENPTFVFDFFNLKGEQGTAGPAGQNGNDGITPNVTATASVTSTGALGVTVTKTGTDENPNFDFAFTGFKSGGGGNCVLQHIQQISISITESIHGFNDHIFTIGELTDNLFTTFDPTQYVYVFAVNQAASSYPEYWIPQIDEENSVFILRHWNTQADGTTVTSSRNFYLAIYRKTASGIQVVMPTYRIASYSTGSTLTGERIWPLYPNGTTNILTSPYIPSLHTASPYGVVIPDISKFKDISSDFKCMFGYTKYTSQGSTQTLSITSTFITHPSGAGVINAPTTTVPGTLWTTADVSTWLGGRIIYVRR